MSLQRLIYVSTATVEHGAAELSAVLASSVRHNRENGITGILLYGRGTFLQVLEGEPAALDETMERICADKRHHSLVVLERSGIVAREFGNWFMACGELTEEALSNPVFLPLRRQGFDVPGLENLSPTIRAVLQGFADVGA